MKLSPVSRPIIVALLEPRVIIVIFNAACVCICYLMPFVCCRTCFDLYILPIILVISC